MEQAQPAPDLRSYINTVSRRRWLVIAVFLTVILSTAAVTWRLTPIYEGVARVEVQPTTSAPSDASRVLEALVDPTRGLQTQVELVRSQVVLAQAADQLQEPTILEDLERNLSIELLKDTQIIEIRAEDQDPKVARDKANAIAESYIKFRRDRAVETSASVSEVLNRSIESTKTRIGELDAQIGLDPENTATLNVEREAAFRRLVELQGQLQALPDAESVRPGGSVISPATTPDDPVRPQEVRNMAMATVAGLILALGVGFLAENLDDRMKSREDVEERVGAPALGSIPFVKAWDSGPSASLEVDGQTGSMVGEAYRTLRTNLGFVSLERPLRTLLVTSAVAGEGKSTAAANLAVTLAEAGSRVVLVSADLRRPSVHKLFGLTNSVGLMNAMDSSSPFGGAVQSTKFANLKVLATGGLPPNPAQILASSRFNEMLSALTQVADYVVIDAPPVLGLGDASALASKVDGILLVVRTNNVKERDVSHAVDQLKKAGGVIVGCLLNAVEGDKRYVYYNYEYVDRERTNGAGRVVPVGLHSLFAPKPAQADQSEPEAEPVRTGRTGDM